MRYDKKLFLKKAALNLSVEAIIIFVLAFAMLGVGIFVTDQLREIGIKGIEKSETILESIGQTPTAEDPIVGITESGLNLPANDKAPMNIGYYNAGRTTAYEATILVEDCKSGTTGEKLNEEGETYAVTVVSSTEDVEPSTAEGFKVVVNNKNLESEEIYICKLKIVKESERTLVYESDTFYLNVIG